MRTSIIVLGLFNFVDSESCVKKVQYDKETTTRPNLVTNGVHCVEECKSNFKNYIFQRESPQDKEGTCYFYDGLLPDPTIGNKPGFLGPVDCSDDGALQTDGGCAESSAACASGYARQSSKCSDVECYGDCPTLTLSAGGGSTSISTTITIIVLLCVATLITFVVMGYWIYISFTPC